MTSVNISRVRNILLAGAVALGPMIASAAIVPAAAATSEPVVAVTLLASDGEETGGIEYRDEHGNVVEPVHNNDGFDRSQLARVDGGDEAPLPAEVDADGDGYVDIMPFDDEAAIVPISADLASGVDHTWIPGLVGGAALGSLATFLTMRRRRFRVATA